MGIEFDDRVDGGRRIEAEVVLPGLPPFVPRKEGIMKQQ